MKKIKLIRLFLHTGECKEIHAMLKSSFTLEPRGRCFILPETTCKDSTAIDGQKVLPDG